MLYFSVKINENLYVTYVHDKNYKKKKSLSDILVVLAFFVVPFSVHFDPCIQPIFVHFSSFWSILTPSVHLSTHFGAFMRRKNQSDEKREPIIRNYKTKLPKFINHYKSVKIKERKKKLGIELN